MKEQKPKKFKCKLNTCLNYENGSCFLIIPFLKRLIANSIKCPFFDDDFEKNYEIFKSKGGTLGALARLRGRKTPEELKEVKKLKRKPRSDKGKPKARKKKKEENSLKDLL